MKPHCTNIREKSLPRFLSLSHQSGFTLLELLISMAVSTVLFGTILIAYQLSIDTFDSQVNDTNLWVELRDASSTMSRDLRDANAVDLSSDLLLLPLEHFYKII